MSPVLLFVLFFVILLFAFPISVTMGITSILPWLCSQSYCCAAPDDERRKQSASFGHSHVHAFRHDHGKGRHFQKAV